MLNRQENIRIKSMIHKYDRMTLDSFPEKFSMAAHLDNETIDMYAHWPRRQVVQWMSQKVLQ